MSTARSHQQRRPQATPVSMRQRVSNLLKEKNNLTQSALINQMSETQAEAAYHMLSRQLAPLYPHSADLENFVNDAEDKTDVGLHTVLRLVGVTFNVLANGTNTDAENPNSPYNQVSGNIAIGYSLAVLTIAPVLIGVYLRYKQIKDERMRNSVDRQQALLQKVNPKQKIDVIDAYNDLLRRGKAVPRPTRATSAEQDQQDQQIKQVIGTNKFARKYNQMRQFRVKGIRPVGVINSIWNTLVKAALVFWPTWYVAVLVVGITATAFPPALPIIMGITLGLSVLAQGLSYYFKRRAAKRLAKANAGKNADQLKFEATERAEIKRSRLELRQRLHMKTEHGYFKSLFNVPKREKAAAIPVEPAYLAVAAGKDKIVTLIPNPNPAANAANTKTATPEMSDQERAKDVEKVLGGKLGQHLLGSKSARRTRLGVSVTNELINQYTMTAFILWLVSSGVAVFAPFAAAIGTIAGIVGGGAMVAGLGSLFGGIWSMNTFTNLKLKEAAFKKKVYDRLTERYESSKPELANATKETAFNYYEAQVNAKKAQVKHALAERQQALAAKAKQEGIASLSEKERYLLNYKLDDINVYNDRYFQKQETKPSLWTRFKKGAFRFYKAFTSFETGAFVIRSLFLIGGVAAGACLLAGPAAGFVFLGIGLGFGLTCGILRLVQMHHDKRAQQKEMFVDTFDARISYLKKKDKQLAVLLDELKPSTDKDVADACSKAAPQAGLNRRPQAAATMKHVCLDSKLPNKSNSLSGNRAGFYSRVSSSTKKANRESQRHFNHGMVA